MVIGGGKRMISRANLDKRICDCDSLAENTETYREFIKATEKEFELMEAPIDIYNEGQLSGYLNFLDDLWNK